ncbi:aminoglycoside phosphotransferase family protein [Paenibacillus sp. FSL R7-0652]|uniref:aminoglycoside phosphotransferase family protein n=1 Tax=Paenibacillus sp. FSL R7-0652 TaxID=2921687 RepID=UPI003159EF0D
MEGNIYNQNSFASESGMIERVREIPELRGAVQIQRISKGYSKDHKFKIMLPDQGNVLLRIYSYTEMESKRQEIQVLEQLRQMGVLCQIPLGIGRLDDNNGYMILSYLEGEDASEVLPLMSEQQQWDIGMKAGRELKRIHQLPVQKQDESWYTRKSTKHQRYVERYQACPVVMAKDQYILDFIDDHLDWMKGRPDCFQHDDFHPANLVVNQGELSGVIDFNRADQGDPVHEFLKLGLFATEISVPYSIGQVQGYFEGYDPDEEFWNLYSLYTAMALVSSVVWIQNVKPDETDQMMTKIERVREDHDDFRSVIPRWYTVNR